MAQASRPRVSTIVTDGVEDAKLLEVKQAAAPRFHFALDRGVEAAVLAREAAERAHQRHVADDVDHFAVDRRPPCRRNRDAAAARAAARRNISYDHDAGDDARALPAIGRLIVQTSAIAATVAAQGGSTFQTNMFSAVKMAFDVAVTRLVSVPGRRSAK